MTKSTRQQLLSKTGYLEQIEVGGLSSEEKELLNAAGYWLEALATGQAKPATEKGRQFVAVANGKKEPTTKYELAWVKLEALKIVYPVFQKLAIGDFSSIRDLRGDHKPVVYDCLVDLLRDSAENAKNPEVRRRLTRAEVKVRDVQSGRQSRAPGEIVNWGDLQSGGPAVSDWYRTRRFKP